MLHLLILVCTALSVAGEDLGELEAVPVPGPSTVEQIVQTAETTIHGAPSDLFGDLVSTYLGIRYAKPPVDDLRWKAPQMFSPDPHTIAVDYGKSCLQTQGLSSIPSDMQSEDCLTLNVFVPENGNQNLKAVLVWFHGGYWAAGGSVDYPGDTLVHTTEVIVVTVNYRLGVLGYFANDQLEEEAATERTNGKSGNYGLLDKILALKWVQENIEAFGGDPKRVTIWGESAGSYDVSLLMVSPMSEGLFHRAIMESGAALIGPDNKPSQVALLSQKKNKKLGDLLVEQLGCDVDKKAVVSCLRGHDAQHLVDLVPKLVEPCTALKTDVVDCTSDADAVDFPHLLFTPIVDGEVVPDDPQTLFEEGKFQDVDILFGSNTDEGTVFIRNIATVNQTNFGAALNAIFGVSDELVKALYTLSPARTGFDLAQILGDFFIHCPSRRLVKHVQKQSVKNIHAYHFDLVPSYTNAEDVILGVAHGIELRFFWGLLPAEATDAEKTLSQDMMSFLGTFATDGALLESVWPTFGGEETYLLIQQDISFEVGYRKSECDSFDLVIDDLATCMHGDQTFESGDSFDAGDGCNTCICDVGEIMCTTTKCSKASALSGGTIAGIVIGVIVGIGFIVFCFVLISRHKRDTEEYIPMPESQDEPKTLYKPPVRMDKVAAGRDDDGL